MTYLGILIAYIVAVNRADKFKVSFRHFLLLCASTLIGMFVGSRMLYIVTVIHTAFPEFSFQEIFHLLIGGGFVFYGGLYGALLGLVVAAKLLRIETNVVMSIFVFSLPVFHLFGRIGCFFAGCCYGIVHKYGVRFVSDPNNLRLPTQLYESALNALIVILLLALEKGKKEKLLFIYLGVYAVARFFLEFIRGDEIRGAFLIFTTSQWVSILTLLILSLYHIVKRHEKLIASN
jgi:phosphatidylglycerol:prolipoprotein diacylglycerol transferase